jgi:hypothetical protein
MDIVNPIPPKNPTPMIVSNQSEGSLQIPKETMKSRQKIPNGFPRLT